MTKRDKFSWRVNYNDGHQIDENTWGRSFLDIPTSGIESLDLYDGNGTVRAIVRPTPASQPVFFRRKRQRICFEAETTGNPVHAWTCIGFKKDEFCSYTFIDPDGLIIVSDNIWAV